MKHILAVIAGLAVAATAFGQGTVFVATHIGDTLNAPVSYSFGSESGPADGRFLGQLLAGPVGGTLSAVGAALPFRSEPEAARGYIDIRNVDTTRVIPGVAAGAVARLRLVAWPAALGPAYEDAKAYGVTGESPVFEVLTGGGLNPPSALHGLQGFTITASDPTAVLDAMHAASSGSTPEPSAAALTLLGAAVLTLRRCGKRH